MDRLQVSVAWLLLKVTFEHSAAGALLCPTCPEGYFLKTNCSVNQDTLMGIQCEQCTDCSASLQDTLVKCSRFADSVCINKTTTTTTTVPPTVESTMAAVSAFKPWTILLAVTTTVFLSCFILILLSCRFQQQKKHPGNNLLSADHRLLPPCDTP